MKRIDSVIETITQVITENGGQGLGYCPVTGIELNSDNIILCNINNAKVTLSLEGQGLINNEIQIENARFDNTPRNYLRGFGGIFIGTVVGVVIFIILFILGVVSAWSSLIAMVLGTYLYKKFGGRQDKVMGFMSSITTFVSFILTIYIIYVLTANGLAVTDGLGLVGIDAFKFYIEADIKFKGEFYNNLMLTIVFTLIGVGYEVFYLLKLVRRKKSISGE